MSACDSGVCKHDVQPAIALKGIVYDRLDSRLVCGVELAGMYLATGVERLDLSLMVAQILVVKVADIDGLGAILGELVCCGSPYAYRRVGSLK